jgi:hypothetical protein
MTIPQPAKQILGIAATAALLGGCNGTATQPRPELSTVGASAAIHNGNAASTLVVNPKFAGRKANALLHLRPLRGKIAANTKTFWISDAINNVVQVFSYPSGTYLGTAPTPPEGFSEPQGMCSDKSGDVFVANSNEQTIDEYSGMGRFLHALSNPGEYPVGCSVDPSSGTLAVSNIYANNGPGGISLYQKASGSPQQLTDPNLYQVYFIAYYGRTGKLYYSGFDNSYYASLGSYIKGKFRKFTMKDKSIEFPGTVAYADYTKSLVIGDQGTASPTFYQVKDNGNVIGTTVLACPGNCDIAQATVEGEKLIGPDVQVDGSIANSASIYPYPVGGQALVTVTAGFSEPTGSAVSIFKR